MAHKVLIIIRGLPGSGKSTLARHLEYSIGCEGDTPVVCEADTFFLDNSGYYNFRKEDLPEAHRWCYNTCMNAMENNTAETIIVSNTACSRGEYIRYIDLARQYDYAIQVIDVHGEFTSVHGVPQESLDKIEERWEPFDRSLLA